MADRAGTFAQHLEHALTVLAREAPVHFAATRRRLGDRAAVIRVGDEPPVRVRLAEGPPWTTEGHEGEIELAISRPNLDLFLLGEFTIEEGIASERLAIRGGLDHILAFLDALASWLHGALRAPSFAKLHQKYLAGERPEVRPNRDPTY